MAVEQKYGIKYPFENNSIDGTYVDLNESQKDSVKSQVLHVLFTPKGQKLRDPEFGTELTKFLYDPKDDVTSDEMIKSISKDLKAYVPNVTLEKITVANDENDEHSKVLIIHYSTPDGNTVDHTTAIIKI